MTEPTTLDMTEPTTPDMTEPTAPGQVTSLVAPVFRLVMRSFMTCELCGRSRTDGKEECRVVTHTDLDLDKYATEDPDPTGIIWACVSAMDRPGVGTVSCSRPECLKATRAAIAAFVATYNIVVLSDWLPLVDTVRWWRRSRKWMQTGMIDVNSHGYCITGEDAATPVLFEMNTSKAISGATRPDHHATRGLHLREILKATPRLWAQACQVYDRCPIIARQVDLAAPPTLEKVRADTGPFIGRVGPFIGQQENDLDLYAVYVGGQTYTPSALTDGRYPTDTSLYNNAVTVIRRDETTRAHDANVYHMMFSTVP